MGPFQRVLWFIFISLLVPACSNEAPPKTPPTIPAAPSGLTATLRSSGRIALAWIDNSPDEIGFQIERSDDGGASFAALAALPADAEDYMDTGLAPGATYVYRVTAWNSAGSSSPAGPLISSTRTLAWSSTPGGPGLRAEHSAVYDILGRRMLLFGGYDEWLNFYGDVWVLDLTPTTADLAASATGYWSPLATTADTPGEIPTERIAPAAIYDRTYHRMVVFGGQDNFGYQNDVFVLDLTVTPPKWTKAATTGTPPTGRLRHSGVFDAAGQRMLVYGGNDMDREQGDVGILSLPASPPFAWSPLLPPAGPIPRTQHSAAFDAARREMIVFGGLDNNGLADGSVLSQETWGLSATGAPAWAPWTTPGTPTFHFGHSAVFDAANDRMVIFGGALTTAYTTTNEMRSLRLDGPRSWIPLVPSAGPQPPGRMGHSAIYDPVFQRMVVFGGNDDGGNPQPDTWIVDF